MPRAPITVTYGTSGIGSAQHRVMERLSEARGVRLTRISYRGTGPAITDLLGKQIDVLSDASGWAPFVDSGKVRLLAVYGNKRLKRWPRVPTLIEAGFDIAEEIPFGLIAPSGVEPAVTKKLHDAFKKAMDDPQFLATLGLWGQEPRYMTGEEYRKYMLDRMPIEKAVVDRYPKVQSGRRLAEPFIIKACARMFDYLSSWINSCCNSRC